MTVWMFAYAVGAVVLLLALWESGQHVARWLEARRTSRYQPLTLDFTAYRLRSRAKNLLGRSQRLVKK